MSKKELAKRYLKSKMLIALMLVFVLVCTNVIINAKGINEISNDTVEIDGVIFNVINEGEQCKLIGKADGLCYEAVLDKNTNEVHITCEEAILFWTKEVYEYEIEIENYNEESVELEFDLTDCNTGEVNHINETENFQGQIPIAIPVGIALTDIIAALLTTAAVCVVAGVAYYAVSDVIEKVKEDSKKKKKYFYYAMIRGSQLLIGEAFKSEADALIYAKSMLNSSKKGVFCVGATRASGLAASSSPVFLSVYDSKHGSGDGYRAHYHPRITQNGSSHYSLHCWF